MHLYGLDTISTRSEILFVHIFHKVYGYCFICTYITLAYGMGQAQRSKSSASYGKKFHTTGVSKPTLYH